MQRLEKAKFLLSKKQLRQLKLQSNQTVDDNDYVITSEDLDLHRSYPRPRVISVDADDADVPERVLDRLAEIRRKAVKLHQKKWG